MGDRNAERRPGGELKAGVLAALWAADSPLSPGQDQVQEMVGGSLARTTVTTILSRQYEKGPEPIAVRPWVLLHPR
ncbi:hypothetical protein ACFYRL_36335 [Streptomyces goshikiensis]|uniref:hypothetical protein n=1 Tax=Streptomyces goshikiensis TaxID=1942 RepID=UPI0036AABCBE